MNDTVLIRPKRNEHSGKGKSGFVLMKRSKNPDQSQNVVLKITSGANE